MGANAAFALPTDDSEAEGRLLTGNTAAVDLNSIADLAGAYSADPSASGAVNHPLSADVLNALNIDLGDGLQLFGPNGIVGVGALGQYANTAPGAVPLASSGLVNADGSIAVGSGDPTENAYVDLGPILAGAGLDALLDDARLELGAISGLATYDEAGAPQGDYQIASGTLLLTSPAIAALTGELVDTLGQVSGPINDLAGEGGVIDSTINPLLTPLVDTLNGLLLGIGSIDELGVTATVDLDLEAAVESALAEPLTSEDSVLTIDLSTGTVAVDLARLVADTQGGDYDGTLNGLPVNTELLDPDLVQAALDGAIGSTLDQIPGLLVEVVTDALHAADVNIAITGAINSLLGNIGTVDIRLSGTLGDFVGAPGSTPPVVNTDGTSIVGLPVGTLLTPILSTVTGTILPALVTPLANAITDEGTLDTIFRPIVEALNTALQPLFGLVTNNLLSLTANVQEEPGDFVTETALDDGSFTQRALQLTLLPAASTPLVQLSLASATVRAEAAAEVAITSPTDGAEFTVEDEAGTTDVEVTGTGEPGATVTVSIPGATDQTATVAEDGTWTVTFPTVPVGEHTITATQEGGSTDSVDVSVVVDAAAETEAGETETEAGETETEAGETETEAGETETEAGETETEAGETETEAGETETEAGETETEAGETETEAGETETEAGETETEAGETETEAGETETEAGETETEAGETETEAGETETEAGETETEAGETETEAGETETEAGETETEAGETETEAGETETEAGETETEAGETETEAGETETEAGETETEAGETETEAGETETEAGETETEAGETETEAGETETEAGETETEAGETETEAGETETEAGETETEAGETETEAGETETEAGETETEAGETETEAGETETEAGETETEAGETETEAGETETEAGETETEAGETETEAGETETEAGETETEAGETETEAGETETEAGETETEAGETETEAGETETEAGETETEAGETETEAGETETEAGETETEAGETETEAGETETEAGETEAADADGDVDAGEIGITVEVPTLSAGDTQTAIGTGFQPGETVTGVMTSDRLALGTQVAGDNGEVTFVWEIPEGTDLGTHTVTLTGAESGSVSDTFRVVASGNGALPATGLDLGAALPIGIVLMMLGVAGYMAGRKKMTI